MSLTRRAIIRTGAVALAAPAVRILPQVPLATSASAQERAQEGPPHEGKPNEGTWRHGLSLFGEPQYPEGFKHFAYVNPNAPKGGTVRQIAFGTFDNFNLVVAGVKGSIAGGIDLVFDTLMASALDEVSTEYGLLAEAVSYPADFSSVTYRLRADAKWHDGKPITPEDVIFSFDVFKKNSPQLSAYYRHVTKAEKTGEREITFTFDSPGNRELPQIVGQLNVLPKHWWEGTDSGGRKRDVTATTLEPPLGCGAYRLKDFVPGRSLVYERVKNYWGKDINVNVGRDNFDEIRYEYFRDSTVAIEAFKADVVDWRTENSAKNWATAYDFAAVRDKRVILEEFPIQNVGVMQAFAFNTRRPRFQDPRVRRAFNFAFDFEEMNRTLSTGEYHRDSSYFDGIPDFMATGLPEGLELEMLEAVRDKVPAEVFTTPYKDPVGGTPEAVRNNLREATRLLKEAGFEVRDRKLIDSAGQPVSVEILCPDEGNERISLFYKPSLERLGVTVSIRRIDDVQFQNRTRDYDFDMTTWVWPQSLSPGNEQRDWFGSKAAERPGSRNLGGIRNPAVDALIERIIFAKNRAEQTAACKAMDRVLLWNFYCVPHFNYGFQRYARWDRFSHPDPLPKYGVSGFPTVWWYDADKAAKIGKRS